MTGSIDGRGGGRVELSFFSMKLSNGDGRDDERRGRAGEEWKCS